MGAEKPLSSESLSGRSELKGSWTSVPRERGTGKPAASHAGGIEGAFLCKGGGMFTQEVRVKGNRCSSSEVRACSALRGDGVWLCLVLLGAVLGQGGRIFTMLMMQGCDLTLLEDLGVQFGSASPM